LGAIVLRAYIVVDVGFGDSGKGLLTDFLTRHTEADVVVRYNGGAQAAHNVVASDGRHHTFSQFGAGTFLPHVKTYLSRHVVVHPSALLVEGDLLESKGVWDPFSRLHVSEQALIITPFHQAANRIRELVRGQNRHGSCGVGVGEAVEDSLVHPESSILAGDIHNSKLLRHKLNTIREQKREEIFVLCKEMSHNPLIARELEIFNNEDISDAWISSIARIRELGLVVSDSILEDWLQTESAVFEGAQGVLLDADAGFHPYTTWSRCTSVNAMDIIRETMPTADVFQIGVMRSYAVRHGPGPFPTETDELAPAISEHNQPNDWQGTVRYGWFDAVLTRYALQVTGGMDMLAITHMDVLPYLNTWKYCQKYENIQSLHDVSTLPLEERAMLSQALLHTRPVLESCDANEEVVLQKIETLLGQPIGLVSYGPRAENVQLLCALK
jgi:adenylosuccinate synthase